MTARVDHIDGRTFHGRKGEIDNTFHYTVDYVLLDAEASEPDGPHLFSRNKGWLFALHDSDHGGPPTEGRGAQWVRETLAAQSLDTFDIGRIDLLAQPRILGHVFNPVSFWLVSDREDRLRVVIPEVTNTYGDRHSYLCYNEDLAPITREQELTAKKVLHVSPFQRIEGGYRFRFDIRSDKIGIWIDFTDGNGGLIATLTGARAPLRSGTIFRAMIRRPFGSRRVLGLIHWQALKLWIKGARFHNRPEPPAEEVSR